MAVCDTSNSTKVGNGDITSAPTLIDSNNFMYMHPFDNIGAMLVPVSSLEWFIVHGGVVFCDRCL